MGTDCKECDKSLIEYGKQCPKHWLEYLQWKKEQADNEYMEELRNQSKKGRKDG